MKITKGKSHRTSAIASPVPIDARLVKDPSRMWRRGAASLCLLFSSFNAFAQTYTFQDLGPTTTTGATGSVGYAINDTGQIAGLVNLSGGGGQAAIWGGTSVAYLGALPGGLFSSAGALNGSGTVVGYSSTPTSSEQAALWIGTSASALAEPLGVAPPGWSAIPIPANVNSTIATGINNSGQVLFNGAVNFVNNTTGMTSSGSVPFLWINGTASALGPPVTASTLAVGLPSYLAYGLNNSGQAVGTYQNAVSSGPALFVGATMSPLGTFASFSTGQLC
jgi:hypothetical protein